MSHYSRGAFLAVIVFLSMALLVSCGQGAPVVKGFEPGKPLERFPPLAVVNQMYLKAYPGAVVGPEVVMVLRGGDIVRLVDRSLHQDWQGNNLDYWYLVEHEGQRAWAFGRSLNLCDTELAAKLQSDIIQAKVFP